MTQSPSPEDNSDKARLKLRRVAIDTYHENVAYLHRNCELYRAEGFQALSKIVILANGRRIYAVLNVVDDEAIVGTEELGLAEQAFAQLDMQPGEPAWVVHAEPVESMDAVRRKIRGERLLHEDYRQVTRDIAANRYSKMEMAAFLVACTQSGLDREETLYLTRAMAETGEHMQWDAPLVADKHCIGGIPGNRTTMLIVPIVAAHGLLMPKTSSRAITSPAGTADSMSVLAKIASLAGAPMERAAGVDLLKKLGDPVTRGEPLYRIHAAFSADFNFARHLAEQDSGYRIGQPDEISQTYMEI